jgi:regulator of cell morphogenesis and NO signaling
METIETLTLGEIVKKNYKAADIFEEFSLDFCCNGDRMIDEACTARGVDPSLVKDRLRELSTEERNSDVVDFDTWPLHRLIDHIVNRHHKYVEELTPRIKAYLDRISKVHGSRHPELYDVREIFAEVGGELAVHMKKEELMLFPFIKKLERAKENNEPASSPLFSSILSPVAMMKADNAEEGEKLARIAALTNNYTPPPDACGTYEVTFDLLKEFEKDLHRHIHLENNILFPKSIAAEESLRSWRRGQF